MVELEIISGENEAILYDLLCRHYQYTQSTVAKKIIDNFKNEVKQFIKVIPTEYRRILLGRKPQKKLEMAEVSDG
jgi:glutamate synthase (NADPH/NADH) large chain